VAFTAGRINAKAWDAEQIEELRVMWSDGKSTGAIALLTKRTRNSVIGKIHRLTKLYPDQYPTRVNPVRKLLPGEVRKKPKSKHGRSGRSAPVRVTLAPLKSCAPAPQVATTASGGGGDLLDPAVRVGPSVPPLESAQLSAEPARPAPPCCWIVGDTRRRDYRTCDAPQDYNRQTGKFRSYCAEHCAKAFVLARKIDEASFVAFASSR
jgi:hypothetical protein